MPERTSARWTLSSTKGGYDMTGTGTQADPYIPASWSEFVTAIGTSNAYVALAEGTVWDMNEIAPTGVGLITVNAVSIAGNGAEIKNLFFNNGGFKLQYNVSISNLKFIDYEKRI